MKQEPRWLYRAEYNNQCVLFSIYVFIVVIANNVVLQITTTSELATRYKKKQQQQGKNSKPFLMA